MAGGGADQGGEAWTARGGEAGAMGVADRGEEEEEALRGGAMLRGGGALRGTVMPAGGEGEEVAGEEVIGDEEKNMRKVIISCDILFAKDIVVMSDLCKESSIREYKGDLKINITFVFSYAFRPQVYLR